MNRNEIYRKLNIIDNIEVILKNHNLNYYFTHVDEHIYLAHSKEYKKLVESFENLKFIYNSLLYCIENEKIELSKNLKDCD